MSNPCRQMHGRRAAPFPGSASGYSLCRGFHPSETGVANPNSDEAMTPDSVMGYLSTHKEVFEQFAMDYITSDDLNRLADKKKRRSSRTADLEGLMSIRAPVLQERYGSPQVILSQRQLIKDIYNAEDNLKFLYEMANVIGTAIGAESFSLYVPNRKANELQLYVPSYETCGYNLKTYGAIMMGTTVAAYVAKAKISLLLKDLLGDERFPLGIGIEGSLHHSVICAPLTLPTDDLVCVLEFIRNLDGTIFTENELQTTNAEVTWIGTTLYQCQINKTLMKQSELNDFLLEVSKVIFDDVIVMDKLVEKIMSYTKNLVSADRCALFLVDQDTQELYSDLFDEGVTENGKPQFSRKSQIRFAIDKGIAGHVASTGEIINIPDAYKDQRFNREIDKQTGYTTHSILCMPIINKGNVIGVVQMLNKTSDSAFTAADETSFKMFAVYCALALHFSKVYADLRLQSAQLKVSLEQLQYHAICGEDEYQKMAKKPLLDKDQIPEGFDGYLFITEPYMMPITPQLSAQMVVDLVGEHTFDLSKLCKFILTVKKNYRVVPYHNWLHGFYVCQGMYAMLLDVRHRGIFSPLQLQALVIGSLCHDIDHRGYNNAFLTQFKEPLAALYETSVMEQHHYKSTVWLLQTEGLDILSRHSTDEYKEFLRHLEHAIISTDLALYMQNQKKLSPLISSGTFDLNNQEHFNDSVALMMTAADLINVCKPWRIQKPNVDSLYEEFFSQGDIEKEKGLKPIPMFDRDFEDKLPTNQVGFLNFIAMPLYKTLAEIYPELHGLRDTCQENLEIWQKIVAGKSTALWEPKKSVVPSKD